MTTYHRHCQSAPERKCPRSPQCGIDCQFDETDSRGPAAWRDLPIEMFDSPWDISIKWAARLMLFIAVAISAVWLAVVTGVI